MTKVLIVDNQERILSKMKDLLKDVDFSVAFSSDNITEIGVSTSEWIRDLDVEHFYPETFTIKITKKMKSKSKQSRYVRVVCKGEWK